jgi:predicted phosphodiesterase
MPRFVHAEAGSPDEATIRIEGLERAITLVQITDSHMVEVDHRDAETIATGAVLREQFRSHSPGGQDPRLNLRQAIARANELAADYVVLTGDIVHYPSAANLEALEAELNALTAPYLYVPGNHDWQFPHLPVTEATRAEYVPRFNPFTGGNPAFQAREVGGVHLLAIDNSTYQASDAQLAFLQEHVTGDQPCLLFMHIPLDTPSLAPSVLSRWDTPIMMAAQGWTPEKQAEWGVRDSGPSTLACHRLLVGGGAPSLAAIFCGHVHFAHAGAFGDGQVQYVTRPGFEAGYRVIRLIPA